MHDRFPHILFLVLSVAFFSGCGDNECEMDSDCGAGQVCANAGGVLFASKVCVAASDIPGEDMDLPSDMGNPNNANNSNNSNNVNNSNNSTNNQDADMGPASEDMDIPDSCVPEPNDDFCERLGKNCGLVSARDNCGLMRTVSCGDCVAPEQCSATNVCGCVSQSNDEFCDALGLDCGTVTANDNCNMERTVDCGTCPGNQNCGEQAANVCGCPCNIGGTCYPDGSQNPTNPCEICDAARSSTSWSTRTGSCNDGDPCTENDQCNQSGTCQGTPKPCSDPGQCLDSVCDPSNGQCVTVNADETCTDGDPCTENDQCVSGACQGTPKSCADPGPCQDAACNAMTGACEAFDVSGSCDDGNLCTQNDTCSNGSCSGDAIRCADPGECMSASCNPSTGSCETTQDPNGSPCDDGQFCTLNTQCEDGACEGDLRQCDLGGTFCDYFCNEIDDRCSKVDPMCIEP